MSPLANQSWVALVILALQAVPVHSWAYDPNFPKNYGKVKIAHGVLGILSWVVFFPLGAILIRALNSRKTVRVHYVIQLSSYGLFIATAGTGIWMARWTNQLNKYHPIIGLVMLSVAFLQIVGGTVQHLLFYAGRKTKPLGVIHVWIGRTLITLGMINGGLGLLLEGGSTRAQNITYGVIAALIWSVYVTVSVTHSLHRRHQNSAPQVEADAQSEGKKSSGCLCSAYREGPQSFESLTLPEKRQHPMRRTYVISYGG